MGQRDRRAGVKTDGTEYSDYFAITYRQNATNMLGSLPETVHLLGVHLNAVTEMILVNKSMHCIWDTRHDFVVS